MPEFCCERAKSELGSSINKIWDEENVLIKKKYSTENISLIKPTKEEICNYIYITSVVQSIAKTLRKVEDD